MWLMHKDKIVGEMEMRGTSISDFRVVSESDLPIGVGRSKSLILQNLRKWLASRAIPEERQGISAIEKALGCSIAEAQLRAMQVSLTDCYWIKPEGSSLTWNDVNFHDNGFSEQLYDVVIQGDEVVVNDFRLPDLTTDGVMEKTWVHSGNVPVLLKRGNVEGVNEPNILSANEVIASKLARRLELDEVPYTIANISNTGETMCACPCFIADSNEEFVSAFDIARETRSFREDLYERFAEYGFEEQVKDMIYFDHLIRNVDRHERNFGVIRNAETGVLMRMSPIFDSGSCLDYNGMKGSYRFDCKPFFDDRYEQLNMLSEDDIRLRHKIGEKEIQTLIRKVYERFGISERQYELAVSCVKQSHRELTERCRNRSIGGQGR